MIRVLALILVLLPAVTNANQFPALYDVIDVQSDDQLNIRLAPSGNSDIVGALAYNSENVEIVRLNDEMTWGLVNFGEGSGWVSMRYMNRRTVGLWTSAHHLFQCYGTEPFWSATIDTKRTAVSVQHFSDAPRELQLDWATRPQNFAADTIGFATQEAEVFGTMRGQNCNDGMSDREFGIRIDLFQKQGDSVFGYAGCCSIAE